MNLIKFEAYRTLIFLASISNAKAFHISYLGLVKSRKSRFSGVLFPAFGIDLVFVAVVPITSFSPVGLKTCFRFCGLLWCAVYEGDLTGFELITDTDNQLSDRGTAFHALHFIGKKNVLHPCRFSVFQTAPGTNIAVSRQQHLFA